MSNDNIEIEVQAKLLEEREDLIASNFEKTIIIYPQTIHRCGIAANYCTRFPLDLLGRMTIEKFLITINRINAFLELAVPPVRKWFDFGRALCCCTMAISFCPFMFFKAKAICALRDILEEENTHYHEVGIHWRLQKKTIFHWEYQLIIEFSPRLSLHFPD